MICHQFYGGHDITIIPVSDVHLGAPECKEQEFIRFIKTVKETPNVYLTLGGDLINNGTRSSVGVSVFRDTCPPHLQKREMANILSEVKDRIICAVPGNHCARSGKDADDDPMFDIMAKLDLEHLYRESTAFVKIQMGNPERGSGTRSAGYQRPCYLLVVTHGAGGGYLPGAAINRGQRYGYVFDGMDALVLGHTHVPYNIKYSKLRIDTHNNKITEESFKVLCATSWLNYGGYALQKMLNPAAFAEQTMILSGKKKEITIITK